MTRSDCYEKGHTPSNELARYCAKCGERLIPVRVSGPEGFVWHTQAELDRLWHGVDREAARVLTEEER